MISFARPADQDRLNATVYELLRLSFEGTVRVDGDWDASDTLDYLERRMGLGVIPTMRADGSLFALRGKYVLFARDGVVVTTSSVGVKEWLPTIEI